MTAPTTPPYSAGELAVMEAIEVLTCAVIRLGADPSALAEAFCGRAKAIVDLGSVVGADRDAAFWKAVPLFQLAQACMTPDRWSGQPPPPAPCNQLPSPAALPRPSYLKLVD